MSSSRRTNGEINILAMLDGHAPGRRIFARPAVLWYGAAGVAACSLLVVLTWLVRGDTPARDAAAAVAAQAALHPTAGSAAAIRDAVHPDEAYAARDSIQVSVPSMHTPPAEETRVPANTRGAVVVDVAPQAPAMVPAPAMAAAAPAAPAHAEAHHTLVRPQASRSTPPLAHADPVPRQKRAASRTAASATVDTDVALISAILQHTGTHNEAADAAGTAACADKSCNPRLPSRQ
jgi:hypothetical protein